MDVAELFPSVDIEVGVKLTVKALKWFMAEHTSISHLLQPKYLRLARFILGNNYGWKHP